MSRLSVLIISLLLASILYSQENNDIEQFVSSLINTKNEQERETLLRSNQLFGKDELCKALISRSEEFRIQSKYKEAGIAAELSLKIAEGNKDSDELSRAIFQIGKVHYYKSEYKIALDYFQRSLKLREENGDESEVAEALTFIGNAYRQQSLAAEARTYYEKALVAAETAFSPAETARTLNSLCFLDQLEFQYDRAAEDCAKSLSIRRQLGNKEALAESLMAQGRLSYLLNHYEDSVEQYSESLNLYEELQYPYYISVLNSSLGSIYFTEADYVRALNSFEKSLKSSEQQGDQPNIAYALRMIGEIHDAQGNYDVALDYFKRALQIFKKSIQAPVYEVAVQNLIGKAYEHKQQFAEAREWMQRALRGYENIGDKKSIAYGLHDLGTLEYSENKLQAASACFFKASELAEQARARNVRATALTDLAKIAFKKKRYQEALDFAKQASALTPEGELPWRLFLIMGETYLAIGELEQAHQFLTQSINTLEDLRGKVAGGEEDRQRFLASRIEPFHAMVQLLIQQKNFAAALEYAERAKARVLLEVLSGSRTNIEQYLTAEERAKQNEFSTEMTALNSKFLQLNQHGSLNSKDAEQIQVKLQKVRQDRDSFYTALYATHPELRMQRGEIPQVTLSNVSEIVSDFQTALLEYTVTEDQTYLFVIRRQQKEQDIQVEQFTIPISHKNLTKQIDNFQQRISGLNLDFADLSQQLYRLLIGPAEKSIRQSKNLLIIPDAELWNLPFAALTSNENRFLLQDHVILYVPSIAVNNEMLKIRHKKTFSKEHTLFAVGNPITSEKATQSLKSLYRNETLLPLPDAENEVQTLQSIYGQASSKVYIRNEAREDRFKLESNQYRILHVATHGILNDTSPLYSQLVLAPAISPKSEDGMLEAWEIMQLKLNAQFAVLSACNTGRGKIGSGEGVIGLSWALLVAGVPTAVVSYWKVESKSTSKLMIEFHRAFVNVNRGEHFPIAAALRNTALQFLDQPQYRHPFYWASFVVIGAGT
ncbi:MAG TPA: CHAT domain-containing protein [Acidobacteriota bacterium]|nr:CHAT domain-containing protein [Acidobacteriota bacterium]